MKPTSAQIQFFTGVLVWLAVLQVAALAFLSTATTFICNGNGAWPLSGISYLGSGILTLGLSTILGWWAWQSLGKEQGKVSRFLPYAWALLVASGISHTIERLTSKCVLDYWQLAVLGKNIHFNLGDLSLTAGAVLLISLWWFSQKKTLDAYVS